MGLFHTDFFERAINKPWVIALLKRIVPPLDKLLLKISRDWISTAMKTIALVERVGAKSGIKREIVTLCMPDGPDIYLVGSNRGQQKGPAWVRDFAPTRAQKLSSEVIKARQKRRSLVAVSSSRSGRGWWPLIRSMPLSAGTRCKLPAVRLQRLSS